MEAKKKKKSKKLTEETFTPRDNVALQDREDANSHTLSRSSTPMDSRITPVSSVDRDHDFIPAEGSQTSEAFNPDLSYDAKLSLSLPESVEATETAPPDLLECTTYILQAPDTPMTLDQALWYLQEVAMADATRHDQLVQFGAIDAIKVAMFRAAHCIDAIRWGISAFWNLAYLPQNEATLLEADYHLDVLDLLLLFPDSQTLLEVAFGAFAATSCGGLGQIKLMETGGGDGADEGGGGGIGGVPGLVLTTLANKNITNSLVIKWGCTFLANVAEEQPINQQRLGEAGVAESLVVALENIHCDNEAITSICMAIEILTKFPNNRAIFVDAGIPRAILRAMQKHIRDRNVQDYGCDALNSLLIGGNKAILQNMMDLGLDQAVRASMEAHPDDYGVHASARRVLSQMSGMVIGTIHWIRALYNNIQSYRYAPTPV